MRRPRCWVLALLVATGPAAVAFDSALAPYPWRQDEPRSPAVEALLHALEANASHDERIAARVRWQCQSVRKLDGGRDRFGPFALKSSPNWRTPKEEGYWPEGEYVLRAVGADFLIEKPADADSKADWWQKQGEHIYSRAFSESWHATWRLHHDALEADSIGYCETLGVLLWAFQPGESIRRADHLEVGPTREVKGTSCATLIATPAWIQTPYEIQNRKHYPFNATTLETWAVHRPVITYYVDSERGMVTAAEFVYYKIRRSSPGDWMAESKPSGTRIVCLVEEADRTANGTWYPKKIVAAVYDGDTVCRRTTATVMLEEPPASLPPPPLEAGKRTIDWWPHYRPEVYEELIRREGPNHANHLGLARALCYEGDTRPAVVALFESVAELERDRRLLPETFGGIDWEFGFPVYELLWRCDEVDVQTFWDAVPRTSTWSAILARAVSLYQQYRPKEIEKIQVLLDRFGDTYEKRKQAQVELTMWEDYLWCLQLDLEWAKDVDDAKQVVFLESLIGEVTDKITESKMVHDETR